MKILIEIHCETKDEVFAHLWRIKTQLKKEFKTNGELDEIEKDFELEDSNCYGEHDVYGYVNDEVQLAIDVSQARG